MKKKFLLLIIFLFSIISQSVFAVSNTILLDQAKRYTNEHLYNESIITLGQILNNTPEAEIKRKAMYLMVKNYKNLGDINNTIKYQNEVINIEKKLYSAPFGKSENISHRLAAAYINQMLFLSYKLNDTYIKSKQLDNVIINDITKIIYEIDKNTHYYDNNQEWDNREFFEKYALAILYLKDIDSILKFRLTNMVLPFLTKRECAKDCGFNRQCGCHHTTLSFFRVYFVLLNKILETEDNEFIAAGTTKEKVLDVIKTKKSVLTDDYDKDLFEALNYYYLGDTERANELKNLIKYNYHDKYSHGNEYCVYSMTDYVFKEVQSYVSKYCPQKKKQKKKR